MFDFEINVLSTNSEGETIFNVVEKTSGKIYWNKKQKEVEEILRIHREIDEERKLISILEEMKTPKIITKIQDKEEDEDRRIEDILQEAKIPDFIQPIGLRLKNVPKKEKTQIKVSLQIEKKKFKFIEDEVVHLILKKNDDILLVKNMKRKNIFLTILPQGFMKKQRGEESFIRSRCGRHFSWI